ncbi:MAG: trypsin-like peptidase domain-containing protein [bacterium]|nr:trypsin-like peptidase domain-containing protein [bacterium]
MKRLASYPFPRVSFFLALALGIGLEMRFPPPAASLDAPSFVQAVKRLRPSVVHIEVKRATQQLGGFGGFFERSTKPPDGSFPWQPGNAGAGIIISPMGHILTSLHLVKEAVSIRVRLQDGAEFDGHIVADDESTDLSLLKIDTARTLPPAKLGDSDLLEAGAWVIAIGSPFGLSHSVSVGVVSTKTRKLEKGNRTQKVYIQTDAAINPGNSGGPLANEKGEVVGVNTAIFARGQRSRNLGVGFAIPINDVKPIIDELIHRGHPVRGRLGVTIGPVPPTESRSLGLQHSRGGRLEEVVRGGPADRAGLKRGDIVVSFDKKEILNWEMLARLIARAGPGTEHEITFYRSGKLLTKKIRIGRLPQSRSAKPAGPDRRIGLRASDLTPPLANRFGISETTGVIVVSVAPGSAAARSGVRPGDVILEVDKKPVRSMADFRVAMRNTGEGNPTFLKIRRKQTIIFAAIRYRP